MIVKCPKCRLQFDVPVWSGATQVQCNCARCGTPFTYTVSAEEDVTDAASQQPAPPSDTVASTSQGTTPSEAYPGNSSTPEPTPAQPLPYDSGSSPYAHVAPQTATPRPPEPQPIYTEQPQPVPPPYFGPTTIQTVQPRPAYKPVGTASGKKASGCLLKAVLAAIVIGVIAFVILLQHDTEKSYTADGLQRISAQSSRPQATSTTTRYDAKARSERAPQWIQGNWKVNTEYGGIFVKVRGNTLAETSNNVTLSGSFRYQNHTLFVDFGDGELSVYHLDEENQRIDAGSGLWMEKSDE